MDANMNEDNQDPNSRMMKFDPTVLVVSHIRTTSMSIKIGYFKQILLITLLLEQYFQIWKDSIKKLR